MAPIKKPGIGGSSSYFERSRGIVESILAIMPLLALYEAGISITRSAQINGADAILRRLFALLGPELGPIAWRVVLGGAFGVAAIIAIKKAYPVHRDLILLALEGLAYGALLGPIAIFLQRKIVPFLSAGAVQDGIIMNSIMSIGAGVYEEILFRLGVLSGVYALGRRASATLDASSTTAAIVAILVSSAIFSAFHHYGPGGEPIVLSTFIFRTVAGCLLGGLFIVRGLGVAVYTHAAYDLLLVFKW